MIHSRESLRRVPPTRRDPEVRFAGIANPLPREPVRSGCQSPPAAHAKLSRVRPDEPRGQRPRSRHAAPVATGKRPLSVVGGAKARRPEGRQMIRRCADSSFAMG